jgi:trigger factor
MIIFLFGLLKQIMDVEIPHSLLEEQGRQMYAAKLIELQASMKLSKEQVVSLSSQEMVQNFLISQKHRISDSVKQTLAVAEIFKLEDLKVSKEELETEVENAIAEFKRYNQEYDEERVKEQAQELLEGQKVLDWLKEHAEITYVTPQ